VIAYFSPISSFAGELIILFESFLMGNLSRKFLISRVII